VCTTPATVHATVQHRPNIDLTAGEPVPLILPTTPPKPVVIEVNHTSQGIGH